MKPRINWKNPEEVKAYVKLCSKKNYQKNKDKIKKERDKPEHKLKQKLYYEAHKEELLKKAKIVRNLPENKEREKTRQQTPEYKRKIKERNQTLKQIARVKKWQEENKEHLKKYKQKNSRKILLKKYGLTIERYNKILEQQNNKCVICGNMNNDKRLVVDHNWKNGEVRGLLCKNCNVSLGNLKEDINLFYKCIEYLNKHKE